MIWFDIVVTMIAAVNDHAAAHFDSELLVSKWRSACVFVLISCYLDVSKLSYACGMGSWVPERPGVFVVE